MPVQQRELSYDAAMVHLKKVVYKQRVRVKDFLVDFDKLRSGFVHPNHFLAALSIAGLDKELTPAELQVIADTYTVPRSPSLIMVDYKTFLDDVDVVFTVANLEKTPLADVPLEPHELLDKDRYFRSSRQLPEAQEAVLQDVMSRLAAVVARNGTPVKPFFDDAAQDDNSIKLHGHVTIPQFRQVLRSKLDLIVTEEEAKAIVEKFANEDKFELVNYVAFSNTIDPPKDL